MGHEGHMAVAEKMLDEAMPDADRMRLALQEISNQASEALATYRKKKSEQIELSAWTVYDLAQMALSESCREHRRYRREEIAAGRP